MLEKYFKKKEEQEILEGLKKNEEYKQLLQLSQFQKNNHSYQNFGPTFKEVIEFDAIISEEERQKKNLLGLIANN